MVKVALVGALIVLTITLAMLSSCVPAQMLQELDDPAPGSRATAANPSSTTAESGSGNPSSSYITYQPARLAGRSLTLEGAKAQVRTFLDEPAAVLDGYFVDRAAPGIGSGGIIDIPLSDKKVFMIQRPAAGISSPEEFTVDASTGEVVEAFSHSHTAHTPVLGPVSDAEARATADSHFRRVGSVAGRFRTGM